MKRFVRITALFALFLLTLVVFDKLSPAGPTTPLSGFAVYETKQLTWDFDSSSDYTYDSTLINLSSGEAKLKIASATADSTDTLSLKLPSGNNSELTITDISDSKYKTALLNEGEEYYVDKNYEIASLPSDLQGMLWLETQNSDRDSNKNVSFTANRPARVFVGYSKEKSTAPNWLQNWAYWGQGIATDDEDATPFKLYYREFAAGSITLGSNNKSKAMYIILLNNTGYSSSYQYTSAAKQYNGKLKTITLAENAPEGTEAKIQVRTAQTQQGLESAQWLGPTSASDYYTSTQAVNAAHGSNGGWYQYKATLETADAAITPTLSSVTIATEEPYYPASATITTNDYSFPKTAEITGLTGEEAINGQSTAYAYSTDSGNSWTATSLNSPLTIRSGRIMIRAVLSSDTTQTPALKSLTASYRISTCDENWQAGYTSCSKEDTRRKFYTDANSCGSAEDIPADNGTTESCNYCSPAWTNVNSSCGSDDTVAVNYFYANSCCSDTELPSDCTIPQNTTAVCDFCTPSFVCAQHSSCDENNQETCTAANDTNTCYSQTGLASDSYQGDYRGFTSSCTYDNEAPIVNEATATVAGSTLTITANVTDKSATTATAQLVKGGTAVMNLTLINTTKDTYAASASAAGLKGTYIIVIVAKDSHNNTARTKGMAGIAVQAEKSAETNVVLNLSRKSVLNLTNTTTIELTGKAEQSATGKLIISEHKSDIRNTTKPAGKRELQKYVEVEADEGLKANTASATLRISYTDEEVLAANISEASLAIQFYNETALAWQQLNSTANTALNYVEGNTTHLSLFGIFGAEQNQTPAANATAGETGSTQQAQQQQETGTAGGGGAGNAAEKQQAEKKTEAEKKEATPAANATEADECSYEVKVELAGKPSFINTSEVNATLANTGTCALQDVEINLTKPLDSYLSVENGTAAELGPAESLAFTLKLKAPSEEIQKQPLQGFAVKEQRKKAVYNGKIVITGNGIKGLGLDIEAAGPRLEKEVPMNIEVYELEQKKGRNAIAAAIIAAFILLGVLGAVYNAITRKRNQSNERKREGGNDSGIAKEAAGKPTETPEHEEEKLEFEEKLKSVAEKWNQRQQEEESISGNSEGEDKRNDKLNE